MYALGELERLVRLWLVLQVYERVYICDQQCIQADECKCISVVLLMYTIIPMICIVGEGVVVQTGGVGVRVV